MKYLHIKNLEKYHPGYKDRDLRWAKIYFNIVQGDPDCEMIEDEIDWGRLVKFIILELQAKRPIPLDDAYLTKKGFNLKKRPIELTIKMLQNFIVCDTEEIKLCGLDKDKEEDKDKEKDKETITEIDIKNQWNDFATKNGLSLITVLSNQRKSHIRNRLKEKEFYLPGIFKEIENSDFLLGKVNSFRVDFEFVFKSQNNYIKILEGKYRNGNNKQSNKPSAGFKHGEKEFNNLRELKESLDRRYPERS